MGASSSTTQALVEASRISPTNNGFKHGDTDAYAPGQGLLPVVRPDRNDPLTIVAALPSSSSLGVDNGTAVEASPAAPLTPPPPGSDDGTQFHHADPYFIRGPVPADTLLGNPPYRPSPTVGLASGQKWWAAIVLGLLFAIVSSYPAYLITSRLVTGIGGSSLTIGQGPTLSGLLLHTFIFILIIRVILW